MVNTEDYLENQEMKLLRTIITYTLYTTTFNLVTHPSTLVVIKIKDK